MTIAHTAECKEKFEKLHPDDQAGYRCGCAEKESLVMGAVTQDKPTEAIQTEMVRSGGSRGRSVNEVANAFDELSQAMGGDDLLSLAAAYFVRVGPDYTMAQFEAEANAPPNTPVEGLEAQKGEIALKLDKPQGAILALPADAVLEIIMGRPNSVTLNGVAWDPTRCAVALFVTGGDVPDVEQVALERIGDTDAFNLVDAQSLKGEAPEPPVTKRGRALVSEDQLESLDSALDLLSAKNIREIGASPLGSEDPELAVASYDAMVEILRSLRASLRTEDVLFAKTEHTAEP